MPRVSKSDTIPPPPTTPTASNSGKSCLDHEHSWVLRRAALLQLRGTRAADTEEGDPAWTRTADAAGTARTATVGRTRTATEDGDDETMKWFSFLEITNLRRAEGWEVPDIFEEWHAIRKRAPAKRFKIDADRYVNNVFLKWNYIDIF